MKKLKIGLFGFGCVGQGLYYVLNNSTGFKADIKKVCLKDKNKQRSISRDLITFDKQDILDDTSIDVVVELIDDAEEAYIIVSEALRKGKHVVTANKKMLAKNLTELLRLQEENQVSLLYEASVCGSIPIIRSLEEYFDNEELVKVSGIFNGTTNYILTKTISEGLSYEEALLEAQAKGFAESNPTNDVEGFDAQFKTIITALHAFGVVISHEKLFHLGITTLRPEDIRYAAEKGFKIKLVPVICKLPDFRLSAFVIPSFVTKENHLYWVDQEFNGVIVEGSFSGEQFMQGRGAGSYPTGAAVLSDISALSYGYYYEFKKYKQTNRLQFTNDIVLSIYLRFNNEADIQKLRFESISEKYIGKNYSFVVGSINLQNLIENKKYIQNNQLFIAQVNHQ